MVIGLYCGKEKPGNVKDYGSTKEFLKDFVDELNELITNEFKYGREVPVKVTVHKFSNDTPANALIKETKGHTAYFSCTKCDVEGEQSYEGRNVCFPTYGAARTDESFRRQHQKQHHNGTSLLTNIKGLNMITAFPLDYMHLICLGIVKKLLMLWVLSSTKKQKVEALV